jgi:hypothetical protein
MDEHYQGERLAARELLQHKPIQYAEVNYSNPQACVLSYEPTKYV